MNKKNLGLIALFILLIAAVVLLTVNMLERRQKGGRAHASRG